ncbi:RHS repeat-associated core domain-containing protein [Pseudomonas putida]|uniref:RHS repeat-associated core domain-containing protein n=1 Tax=Pseudomonas putida TaxID=303 RepID=UPI002A044B0F|nr:RHS repeat-associated core domain-containing protein [Pseudomonas putida]
MLTASTRSLYFYRAERPIMIMLGDRHRTILRAYAIPLAEQQSDGQGPCLLAVEDNGTVLQVQQIGHAEPHLYTAYGHDPRLPSQLTLLGFNGEAYISLRCDYPLGNGYRSYSPERMRFNSPDSLSPFGRGGLNAYCYCEDDPVNNVDPSGRTPIGMLWRPRSLPHIPTPPQATHPLPRRATLPLVGQAQTHTASAHESMVGPAHRGHASSLTIMRPARESTLASANGGAAPTFTIDPIQSSQAESRHTSRDSTPPESRSPSPMLRRTKPYFVEIVDGVRGSPYYSPRHDPIPKPKFLRGEDPSDLNVLQPRPF